MLPVGPQSILLRQVMLYLNTGSEPVDKAILLLVAMAVVRFFSVYFMSGAFGITCVFTGGSHGVVTRVCVLLPGGVGTRRIFADLFFNLHRCVIRH